MSHRSAQLSGMPWHGFVHEAAGGGIAVLQLFYAQLCVVGTLVLDCTRKLEAQLL